MSANPARTTRGTLGCEKPGARLTKPAHRANANIAAPLTRRRLMLTSAAAAATAPVIARDALATVQVQISKGNVQAMPIAIPDFLAGPGAEGDMPRNITQIITNNLSRSGVFAPIDQAAYLEKITNSDLCTELL